MNPQKTIRILFVVVLVTVSFTLYRKILRRAQDVAPVATAPEAAPMVNQTEAKPAENKEVAKAVEKKTEAALAPASQNSETVSMKRFSKNIFPSKTIHQLSASLGSQLIKMKAYSTAQKILVDALQTDPKNADLQNNLGYVWGELGDLTKAEEHLRKGVEASSKCAECRNNLASLLIRNGKLDEARKLVQEAVGIDPKYLDAQLSLGLICEYQNDWKSAQAAYKAAEALITEPELKKIITNRVLWMTEILEGTARTIASSNAATN